jgi:hypothetical protein
MTRTANHSVASLIILLTPKLLGIPRYLAQQAALAPLTNPVQAAANLTMIEIIRKVIIHMINIQ